jgi:hypothetical protein
MVRATNKIVLAAVAATWALAMAGCISTLAGPASDDKKTVLWTSEDFTGWHRYVADPAVDVNNVWRIRRGVLYCAGQPNGYIRTEKEYRNYHLHLEWRWPMEPANSGVLLHGRGPDQIWPVCIQCQLKAGRAGDFILMNGAGLTVNGVDRRDPAKPSVIIEKSPAVAERPAGQWNSYDIYCKSGSIRCFVNGILQNEGTDATPSFGWIGLQSESGPIEFRNIYLLPPK